MELGLEIGDGLLQVAAVSFELGELLAGPGEAGAKVAMAGVVHCISLFCQALWCAPSPRLGLWPEECASGMIAAVWTACEERESSGR